MAKQENQESPGILIPKELTQAFLEIAEMGCYEGKPVTIDLTTMSIEEVCKARGVPYVPER